jgi:hypothetical protein
LYIDREWRNWDRGELGVQIWSEHVRGSRADAFVVRFGLKFGEREQGILVPGRFD